jgi:transposase
MARSGRSDRSLASSLGVHESTVRRWDERGLLHGVLLASGVRRFRPDDVEAVREQIFSASAPLRAYDDIAPVRARSID